MYRTPQIHCTACRLHKTRNKVVWGSGDFAKAKVILVGEGPGQEEDETGYPFVGRSGMLLRNTITNIFGIEAFEFIFITNLVQCRPPSNRNPRSDELKACLKWLQYKIKRSPASIVVCIGRIAATELIGANFNWGKWYQGADEKQYTSTYHPSYILRNQGEKNKIIRISFKTWLKMGIKAGGIHEVQSTD
jgi:DNA polymerase